jgi:hypothetical protein
MVHSLDEVSNDEMKEEKAFLVNATKQFKEIM